MCGIAGILNLNDHNPISEPALERMVESLRHRGPDESGLYIAPGVGLGHSRLSIIGVDRGVQPITNEDGTLWIVYNGETFNYPELKEDLVKKGHSFTTSTDTEVIIHLYEEYGQQCLEKINGQFSMAIWNCQSRELFLARDRMGVRPLYFTNTGKNFIFASEIKSIFQNAEVRREIDLQALSQTFTFWSALTPSTIFKGVHELPPGHFLKIRDGHINQEPFWTIPNYPQEECWQRSFSEAVEEIKYLLKDAVRIRLRADVPVGAYLSGGLDSSILTALISNNFNNQLRTFSMSFQENQFDETSYQDELAHFLGTEHSSVVINNADIADRFCESIWHCETPLMRTSPVPLLHLSKKVRDCSFKVVLTGEGADEVFAGYNIFKEAKTRRFWARDPQSKMRPLLLERLYPYVFKNPARGRLFLQQFYAVAPGMLDDPFFSHRIRWENSGRNTTFFSTEAKAALANYLPVDDALSRLPVDFMSRADLSRSQFLEMNIFLPNYLLSSQGDRVAMANSVEMRHPFLDFRLVDFAARLPDNWKIKGLNEKYILKQAFRDIIPRNITQRPKQPYRAPIREAFFANGNTALVDDHLAESNIRKAGYFDYQKIEHLVKKFARAEHSVPSESQNMAMVGILSTQILHHLFIENFAFAMPRQRPFDKVVRI